MKSSRKAEKHDGEGTLGRKPERLVIPPEDAGKVLDRLFATPPEKRRARSGKPGKKKPGSR